MKRGIICKRPIFSQKRWIVSAPPVVYWIGTRCTIFVAPSTMVRIPPFFCSLFGKPIMKSIKMSAHFYSGSFSGWSSPVGDTMCSLLLLAHSASLNTVTNVEGMLVAIKRLLDFLQCFLVTNMARIRDLMIFPYYMSFEFWHIWHHDSLACPFLLCGILHFQQMPL